MTQVKKMLALHEPVFAGNEWRYVKECLDSTWVSSAGGYVQRFESIVADWLGVAHAVAVVNGTSALHLALKVAGVQAGDEVLVPSLTFIAPVNSIVYLNAVPRFVDAEEATLGMDPDLLASFFENEVEARADGHCYNRTTGRRIAACLPVHVLGHPARIDRIVEICNRYEIAVVEDATESLGSFYNGQPAGTFGRLGCLSFNGNKIITTGGGGMVVTNDRPLAEHVRHLSTQAKRDGFAYWHDEVGYNYRLPNLNAALGCAQMEGFDELLAKKRQIAQWYREDLQRAGGASFILEPPGAKSNYWLNGVRVRAGQQISNVMSDLQEHGFASRPLWAPCHQQPMFESLTVGTMEVTQRLWETLITLPSSTNLTRSNIRGITRCLTGSV